MIFDQTVGSARAEGHRNQARQRIIETSLTALLTLGLILASLTNLAAVEGTPQVTTARAGHTLAFPPINFSIRCPA
jgi:hypothetical protein